MINWKCRLQVFLGSLTAGLWHFMIILELAKMRLSLSPFRRRRLSDKTELPMGMTSFPNNMFVWNLPWCFRSQRDESDWMKDRGEKRTDASSERPELQINLTRPSSHPKILSHDNDVENSQPWLAPYGPQKNISKMMGTGRPCRWQRLCEDINMVVVYGTCVTKECFRLNIYMKLTEWQNIKEERAWMCIVSGVCQVKHHYN